ncbi:S-layer homology domain-containing protein [Priestia koreensis]|uniref:S-layer homology domain-containing protein n=1 Tax=Priestia koreensis TaxID=284581 RepID=UPI00203EE648|nr:S-layer homology domain-containing protein [Priestia koreensis]MCM3006305.1 S-layer homology domain-containing protein [Priestia koreensis]
MKKFKRGLAVALAATLLPIGGISSAYAADKPVDLYITQDVVPGSVNTEMYTSIQEFLYSNVINGSIDKNGSVYIYPRNSITRGEFVIMIVNALGLKQKGNAMSFADLKPGSAYYNAATIASSHGIIKGIGGKFAPGQKITRAEIAVMVYRTFQSSVPFKDVTATKGFTDVPAGSYPWAFEAIYKSAANGIVKGSGTLFKPTDNATRGEAIVMMNRALHQETMTASEQTAAATFLKNHILKGQDLLVKQDFKGLTNLYDREGTGFYRAVINNYSTLVQDIMNEGAKMTYVPDQDFTVKPVYVSGHFAAFSVNDYTYSLTVELNSSTMTAPKDASALYRMKKDSSGNWQVYDIQPYSDDYMNLIYFGYER